MDSVQPTSPTSRQQNLASIPWILSSVVAAVAIYVWGSSFNWQFSGLSTYQIFPVLGLLAFSLMWAHYMTGLMRRTFLKGVNLSQYFNWTGYVVLVAIVLHPGLLTYQRWRDGFGLPPGSETGYVANGMAWIVVLGMTSLLVFLAFEFRRWFSHKKWWKFVPMAGDIAMIAIFYHGLELGTQTHIGWFRTVWWFYGLSLIGVLIFTYSRQLLGLEHAQDFDAFAKDDTKHV